jgi:hypothetical protein
VLIKTKGRIDALLSGFGHGVLANMQGGALALPEGCAYALLCAKRAA